MDFVIVLLSFFFEGFIFLQDLCMSRHRRKQLFILRYHSSSGELSSDGMSTNEAPSSERVAPANRTRSGEMCIESHAQICVLLLLELVGLGEYRSFMKECSQVKTPLSASAFGIGRHLGTSRQYRMPVQTRRHCSSQNWRLTDRMQETLGETRKEFPNNRLVDVSNMFFLVADQVPQSFAAILRRPRADLAGEV